MKSVINGPSPYDCFSLSGLGPFAGEGKDSKMPRTLEIGTQNFTAVKVLDEPSHGGACHKYEIWTHDAAKGLHARVSQVSFQKGPIKENGVNGCHNEDLLAIVLDRLQSFQAGEWKCRENAIAITKLEEAMHWLGHRTAGRVKRGVEGTSEK